MIRKFQKRLYPTISKFWLILSEYKMFQIVFEKVIDQIRVFDDKLSVKLFEVNSLFRDDETFSKLLILKVYFLSYISNHRQSVIMRSPTFFSASQLLEIFFWTLSLFIWEFNISHFQLGFFVSFVIILKLVRCSVLLIIICIVGYTILFEIVIF